MNTFSAQDLINAELKRDDKKEIKSWHPSKLGSCLTGAYLERKGEIPDTEFDERTLRVFSVGKMMEEWFIGLIKKNFGAEKIQEQVRIELPEWDMTGYADLLIKNDPDLVYEIKSKHSKSFWYMDKKGEGAQTQHKMQLWTYLKALNLPEGRIIYLSKDDLATLEFPVRLDDGEIQKLVEDEVNILNRAWKEQLPPEPIRDEKDWRAKYCRFHQKCLNQKQYLK